MSVASEGLQVATGRLGYVEQTEIREVLAARGPSTFIAAGEEPQVQVQALLIAVGCAMQGSNGLCIVTKGLSAGV